jgi:hypothetical protein
MTVRNLYFCNVLALLLNISKIIVGDMVNDGGSKRENGRQK